MEPRSTIIADCGSRKSKFGLARDIQVTKQVISLPSTIAEHPVKQIREIVGGEPSTMERKGYKLKYPINLGMVTDLQSWLKIMHHIIRQELYIWDGNKFDIVLCEAPLTSEADRKKVIESLYETFDFHGVYMGSSATFALSACREPHMTGLVIDSGYVISSFKFALGTVK